MRDEPTDREAALEALVERLENKVEVLERAMGFLILPPLEWGLTGSEARLFGALLEREMVTKDAAMSALYRDHGDDEPEVKIVDVFICKIRKKIAVFGLTIETIWSVGYRLSPESKALAREMIAASRGEAVAA